MNPLQKLLKDFTPSCEQEFADLHMIYEYMRLFDNLLLRENKIAHFTASSWIVNRARTKALMAYHNIYDSWAWTGGHTDGDGDLLSVALREAREETGIERIHALLPEAFSVEILPVHPHFKRGSFVVAHQHLNVTFLLEADDTEALRAKPDENKDVRWFTLAEAVAASTEPDMQIVYRKLNEKLSRL